MKLPDNVDFDSAAFTTLGAIALQGIRLAEPRLGDIARSPKPTLSMASKSRSTSPQSIRPVSG